MKEAVPSLSGPKGIDRVDGGRQIRRVAPKRQPNPGREDQRERDATNSHRKTSRGEQRNTQRKARVQRHAKKRNEAAPARAPLPADLDSSRTATWEDDETTFNGRDTKTAKGNRASRRIWPLRQR
jgi:hypothetical protein